MSLGLIVYLLGVVLLIVCMAFQKNVVVPALVATFATALAFNGDIVNAVMSVFRANVQAGTALFELFVVIAIVTAMIAAMRTTGADEKMILPFTKIMRNGYIAFAVLFVVTYALSLFFWPTPALALIGTLLLPAAVKAGLRPLAAGIAIAIAGQGMSIASDYIIGVAPAISASGANVPAQSIADKALIISWIVGAVALIILFFTTIRKQVRTPVFLSNAGSSSVPRNEAPLPSSVSAAQALDDELPGFEIGNTEHVEKPRLARFWAIAVPVAFGLVLIYMLLGRFTDVVPWEDGAGAALVGGTAALLLAAITLSTHRLQGLEVSATHFIDGLGYAFKAMGVIIPVAGFFYLGIPDYSGEILGVKDDQAPQFLFDAVNAVAPLIPDNPFLIAIGMVVLGLIISLDGSGWAGLPLTGAVAASLAEHTGLDTATLAAIAQNASTWAGGGTILIWSSLVAVASFTGVSVITLAKKMIIPVLAGLIVAAVIAVYLL